MSNISKKAQVSQKVRIGENVVIMDGVIISPGVKICNNITIYPNTKIGKDALILDNCTLGREPFYNINLNRKPKIKLKNLEIGNACQIGASVVLYRGSSIGNNVMICDFSSVREECTIGNNVVIGRGVLINYNVKIGNNVSIMDGCHFGGDIVIEDDVFLGPFVSSANDNSMGMNKKLINRAGPYIKKGAKIGLGSILLANITIGRNAVIGAGALVSKDVKDDCLVYGFPARFIRKNKG